MALISHNNYWTQDGEQLSFSQHRLVICITSILSMVQEHKNGMERVLLGAGLHAILRAFQTRRELASCWVLNICPSVDIAWSRAKLNSSIPAAYLTHEMRLLWLFKAETALSTIVPVYGSGSWLPDNQSRDNALKYRNVDILIFLKWKCQMAVITLLFGVTPKATIQIIVSKLPYISQYNVKEG